MAAFAKRACFLPVGLDSRIDLRSAPHEVAPQDLALAGARYLQVACAIGSSESHVIGLLAGRSSFGLSGEAVRGLRQASLIDAYNAVQSHMDHTEGSKLKKLEFPDPFKHDHPPVRELSDIDPGPSSRGEKFADWVYENLGSWRFILIQSILVVVWVVLNATAYVQAWDPYPFIFMNLIFSLQSAYTASLILMSQNRQDRLKAHNDYLMNLRAEDELKAVLDNFAAQNKALDEIYRELSALKIKMEKPELCCQSES